ncbi:MAG: NAD-dependent epimerase/dehydratase family protein [Deltaproteobacteria bacterium]|nr:NAD-dependent epimerase/dehydratase family protein [Deltaproteobacteria bacterium]
MKILIVGGGGFIGSALLKHLAKRHECICFGHGSRYSNLRRILPEVKEFIDGDITNEKLVRETIRGMDAVIDLAGTGGEAVCFADPVRALSTHVYGAHLLLREVCRNNVGRFIFTSTIAVYGTYHQGRSMPLTEDMEPRLDEFYGALKATSEREIIDSGQYQIFRLANVYGSGSGFFSLSSGVVGRFIQAAHEGMPLQIYGDGEQLIDYVHIEDVCHAFEIVIEKPRTNFVYNIGGGCPISIRKLAEIVRYLGETELECEVSIEHVPFPPNKPSPSRWLSIAKAGRELGWYPGMTIEAGIREMFMNYRGKRSE